MGLLFLSQKVDLMGCARFSHHLSDVRCFIRDILPYLILWCLYHILAPCLPHPLGRWERHESRVLADSDTTCLGIITVSQKGRFDGMCNSTAYKPITLPLLIWYGTFYPWHSTSPDPVTSSSQMGPLSNSPAEVLGEILEPGLGWLWYHLSRGQYPLTKRPV